MIELITTRYIKNARKEHVCDYCCKKINKGSSYRDDLCKDDDVYHWKSHMRCSFFAHELWDYIDPDWGLDADGLSEGLQTFLNQFICPNCENFNKESNECNLDNSLDECKDKIYNLLKIKQLKRDKNNYPWGGYTLIDRKTPVDEYSYTQQVKKWSNKK